MYWEDLRALHCWQPTQANPSESELEYIRRDPMLCAQLKMANPYLASMLDAPRKAHWFDW